MKQIPQDMQTGTIHPSKNCGRFKIIKYTGKYDVKIQFLDSGSLLTSESSNIRKGTVKDPMFPSVLGVGFIGIGSYKTSVGRVHTRDYAAWGGMMSRCHSDNRQSKQPTYIGVTVCKEWHNFQNFAEWFELNYREGLHLDKDIKLKGNKVYSPETCMFVSQEENNIEARAKRYLMISPDGKEVSIYNMSAFCRENNLFRPSMCKLISGERVNYKGWSKA